MRRRTSYAALLGALVFFTAPTGLAQPEPAASIVVESCGSATAADTRVEDADQQVLERAMADMQRGGYRGLSRHLEALRGVADRAPACYPLLERRERQTIVRSSDLSEFLIAGALLSREGRGGEIVQRPNTYAEASLVLASYAVEMRQYDDAITLLDRGLALQPRNQLLILERVSALTGARRFEQAEAALRGALADPALALTLNRPRFLRSHGVVLIELNRLDEAEAALNESIRLEPNNPVARNELQYIAQLREGARQRELEITAPASKPGD